MRYGHALSVVGDELHVDGMLVAVLAQSGVPATVMDKLVQSLDGALLIGCADDTVPEQVGTTGIATPSSNDERDELLARLVKASRNGLLRLTDACTVVHAYYDGE